MNQRGQLVVKRLFIRSAKAASDTCDQGRGQEWSWFLVEFRDWEHGKAKGELEKSPEPFCHTL